MYTLGISAFYHDSAAVLLKDGEVLCGIEEERFSRIKHDNSFPYRAIEFVLHNAGIKISEVDAVAYYEKPLQKFERLLQTFVETYPRGGKPFIESIPDWLGQKIKVEDIIRNEVKFKKKSLYFIPHHMSHASATYLTSGLKESAILTIDGVGEYQTTGMWHGVGTTITPLLSLNFPHSVGLLYSTFTAFLGFKVNEDEYKLMGLSAYGKPILSDAVRKVVKIFSDGSIYLNLTYFSFRQAYQMWSDKFELVFGPPRKSSDPITDYHKAIAASIQSVTEEILFAMVNHLHVLVPSKNLCIGGGVALNALANGKLYKKTPFNTIHVLGAAGDSGAALGAALSTYHTYQNPKSVPIKTPMLYFGSDWADETLRTNLEAFRLRYTYFPDEQQLLNRTATYLKLGKILGWFWGKCEYGPRALGARSILAKPAPYAMKTKVNVVKHREQFRPFAASVLQEHVHEYFETPNKKHFSPYMNFCFQVKKQKQKEIAAIVHHDNTCRIQTVGPENGRYYRLLKTYHDITGSAVLLNTSFNLKGEPIVETPKQAIEDFLKTHMDALVIGNFLVTKK